MAKLFKYMDADDQEKFCVYLASLYNKWWLIYQPEGSDRPKFIMSFANEENARDYIKELRFVEVEDD